MTLLLASRSAARRAMLEQAGIAHDIVDAPMDEEAEKARLLGKDLAPDQIALRLAMAKARSVRDHPGALVLGADQVLETAGGAMLSKPASPEELATQLRLLAGTTHRLHAAAALARQDEIVWADTETVSLTMRPLSDRFIADYVAREWAQVRWCVGGYRIEGEGVQLFCAIEGSHFAILGLPLLALLDELRRLEMLAS